MYIGLFADRVVVGNSASATWQANVQADWRIVRSVFGLVGLESALLCIRQECHGGAFREPRPSINWSVLGQKDLVT